MSSAAKEAKDVKESPAKEKKKRRPIKTEKSDGDREPKKARTLPSTSGGPGTSGRDADVAKIRAAFYYEENEVDNRPAQKDHAIHKDACNELKSVMKEICVLKNSDDPDKLEKIEQLRIHGTMQFISLKKINRMAHFRCKKSRDKTNEEKQMIDQHNLRLQNLLYEVMHLQKEITKCLEFKSKDEEINLVPVAEFYKDAPDTISRPDATREDVHQQTLARLEWELEQRKHLSTQLKEAQGNKNTIYDEIKAQQDYLNSLQPKLNTILQSTKPVQEHLEMPFDEIREQQMTATYLPHPLYVLYMQASAYNDACDKHMSVNIEGDVDVAKAMESTSVDLDEDSDSDNEDADKPKEKRRRRNTASDMLEEKKMKILKKHPLSVQLIIKCKDGSSLQLIFNYLVVLKIITVTVKLVPGATSTTTAICVGDLLSADSLLSCLYSEDTGNDTPNKSNSYALQKLGLREFSSYLREVGRPYHWAQWLCGLQFLNVTDLSTKPLPSLSQGHMEGTVKRVRHRIKARMSLHRQLAALERSQVPVSAEYQHLTPTKISARLASWKRSTYSDFSVLPYTQTLVGGGLATELDIYFCGTIERGSAKMAVQVVINQDYPNVAPLFALSLSWKRERSSLNDDNIREMEAEVNIYHTELSKGKSRDQLLTNQIQRLLMCLDVYVESETDTGSREGPVEFSREKIFPRVSRGPARAKPYVFQSQMGFFSHR